LNATRNESVIKAASNIAAQSVLGGRVTIAMANPEQTGTKRNITGPIPLALGVSARKKPPSPTHIPVTVPTAKPLRMQRQFFRLLTSSACSTRYHLSAYRTTSF
jgi:hypothetical protein